VPTVPATDVPISGAVFSLPHIGSPMPSTTRWMDPPPSSSPVPGAAMPLPSQLAALASAQSAQEAGRARLVEAMLRELSVITVPQDIEHGRCTLDSHASALSCDPEPLHAALGERQAVLAGMLDAYRRLVPADPVITLQGGQLQLAAP
jgi:hypothetical protein